MGNNCSTFTSNGNVRGPSSRLAFMSAANSFYLICINKMANYYTSAAEGYQKDPFKDWQYAQHNVPFPLSPAPNPTFPQNNLPQPSHFSGSE